MEANQNTAVHPSRAAKLCNNCRYQVIQRAPYQVFLTSRCDHPSLPISITTGIPEESCFDARHKTCGKKAVLFELPLPRKQRLKVKVGDTYEWRDAIQEPDATSINQENLPKALAV